MKTALVDLYKVSNVVEDDTVKKTACVKLVKKVNAIQIPNNLVKKPDYDRKID